MADEELSGSGGSEQDDADSEVESATPLDPVRPWEQAGNRETPEGAWREPSDPSVVLEPLAGGLVDDEPAEQPEQGSAAAEATSRREITIPDFGEDENEAPRRRGLLRRRRKEEPYEPILPPTLPPPEPESALYSGLAGDYPDPEPVYPGPPLDDELATTVQPAEPLTTAEPGEAEQAESAVAEPESPSLEPEREPQQGRGTSHGRRDTDAALFEPPYGTGRLSTDTDDWSEPVFGPPRGEPIPDTEDFKQMRAHLNELREQAAAALEASEKRRADAEGRVFEMVELANQRLAESEAARAELAAEVERRQALEAEVIAARDIVEEAAARMQKVDAQAASFDADLAAAHDATAEAERVLAEERVRGDVLERQRDAAEARVGELAELRTGELRQSASVEAELNVVRAAAQAADERATEATQRAEVAEQELDQLRGELDTERRERARERADLERVLSVTEQRATTEQVRADQLAADIDEAKTRAESEKVGFLEGGRAEREHIRQVQADIEERLALTLRRLEGTEERLSYAEAGLTDRRDEVEARSRELEMRLHDVERSVAEEREQVGEELRRLEAAQAELRRRPRPFS